MDVPACFDYRAGWVPDPADVFDQIRHELAWEQHDITVYGRTVKTPRLTAWVGDAPYTYSGLTNQPQPWPPTLAALRDRLVEDSGADFNSCLANLYRDGSDSMGYHADDEPELGPRPVIASISLGARRRFLVREPITKQRWSFDLGEGDLLLMRDESQADYRHAVPKTTRTVGPRLNLTFRWLHARQGS